MERIDEAVVLIDAPRESIYQAFVEEEAFKAWMAPDDMTIEIESFNPVEKGELIVKLIYDDEKAAGKTGDNIDRYTGVFKALEPHNRVVFTVEFDTGDERFKGIMEQEWMMSDRGSATQVKVACRNVQEGIDHEYHEQALKENLYRLAGHLGAQVRQGLS